MKIMLIEDEATKYKPIIDHLNKSGIPSSDIIHAKNMTDFAANLNSDIGLFIIDLMLPSIDNGVASQNGMAILESIVKAGKNEALLLAISSHPSEFSGLRESYEAQGCILADFANTKGWQSTLDHLLIQLKRNKRFDFLIFCALQEERIPYVAFTDASRVIRNGIDCYDITIKSKTGTVILMPQMGLVTAAVTASTCIDRFKPTVVGMSGICGGFSDRASLGQLFISSMAYEYQSGKWSADGFQQEPYQVTTDHMTLAALKHLLNEDDLIHELEDGFRGIRPSNVCKPEVGVFTSGSAVIADKKLLNQIQLIHRKVSALDMEVFAIQRAAELSPDKPSCICVKTVVDLCDQAKNDNLHEYGSYISAKFLIKAIENFFRDRHDG